MRPSGNNTKIRVANLSFWYGARQILSSVTQSFEENRITVITGPSGVGKSTFLTTLNRLWEDVPDATMSGTVEIKFGGTFNNIYDRSFPVPSLRRLVAMVFQKPNPLPMSIYRNVAFPLKLVGQKDRPLIEHKTEEALKNAYLWNEVKDRLNDSALRLSGGQQQRLCIARALVLEPEVLLLDEPTSSLDEKAVMIIEDLLLSLKERLTLIAVSHYLDQVKRIADHIIPFQPAP